MGGAGIVSRAAKEFYAVDVGGLSTVLAPGLELDIPCGIAKDARHYCPSRGRLMTQLRT